MKALERGSEFLTNNELTNNQLFGFLSRCLLARERGERQPCDIRLSQQNESQSDYFTARRARSTGCGSSIV